MKRMSLNPSQGFITRHVRLRSSRFVYIFVKLKQQLANDYIKQLVFPCSNTNSGIQYRK